MRSVGILGKICYNSLMTTKEYIPIIGLEIHAELKTQSKMFCNCKNDPEERQANRNVCPICLAHPGTLPVINKKAVEATIKVGLALNCQINQYSKFDRKNYFYPDLPKGYQISQFDLPLCKNGYLDLPAKEKRRIRIRRVHLEEDTGRLVHPGSTNYSLVDFNRAGIPLLELVTEPDLRSGLEARKFAEELQLLLRYLGVSNADMEKGQMRIEANVSLGRVDDKGNLVLGTKVEIKNLNSFKSVERAINYEVERQLRLLEENKKVIQETRGWNGSKEATVFQRAKEEAHDYRYFPEPDLPPLTLESEFIENIKSSLPELPWQKRERFKKEYNLNPKEADVLIKNKDLGEYFEKIISEIDNWIKVEKIDFEKWPEILKIAKNYLFSDFLGLCRGQFTEEKCLITPENFAEFVLLVFQNKYPSKLAKAILGRMFETGKDPSRIIEEEKIRLIGDEKVIIKIVKEVIEENPQAVRDFKGGKVNALQFLIGQVMNKTQGRLTPDLARKFLEDLL